MRINGSHLLFQHRPKPDAVTVSGTSHAEIPRGTLETAVQKAGIREGTPLACLAAVVLCAAIAGCSFSVTPGKGSRAEWIGTHQRQQAAEKDRDRDTALAVRAALADDPVLKKLDLRIFVDRGSVKLCGDFPNATTRERTVAVLSQVQGVKSVNTHCGQ